MAYDTTKKYIPEILRLIEQTWQTPFVSVNNGIVTKNFFYQEYYHSDGIGTKGVYHWKHRTLKNAVQDALAMNLNDLVMERAKPYALIDHIMLPKDDKEAIIEIVSYLTEECKKRDISITSGETSIHNNLNGLEISITMLGFIERYKPNMFQEGDVLIGVESNGLHSNGFTKLQELFNNQDNDIYKEEFVRPTNIYSDLILGLNKKFDIHGMMHITGGAFTKLKKLLRNRNIIITREHGLAPQNIFYKLHEKMSDDEMYKIFNCGIGFIFSIDDKIDECLSDIKDFKADAIGKVVSGKGEVKIYSKFSDKIVVY